MMEKKMLSVFLILVLVCLAGCGTKEETALRSDVDREDVLLDETEHDPAQPEDITESQETEDEETEEFQETVDEETDVWGIIEGREYQNNRFGISFSLPEDWSFLTPEEIMETSEIMIGLAEGQETMQAALEEMVDTYDMMASTADYRQNIQIVINHLEGMEGITITEDDMLFIMEAQLPQIEAGAMEMGIQDFQAEIVDVSIGKEIRKAIKSNTIYSDEIGEMCQLQIMFFQSPDLMLITITVPEEAMLENVLSALSFVEPLE